MGCCNEPAIALTGTALDPARHVNYAKGMVLGVDDFTQEFTYLAGRDQWLARDAIGYGTLSGLAVFMEDGGADGPRLRVAPGSALVPSGKLVCVPADQCCLLNKWLAKPENATAVTRLLGGSPPLSPPMSPAPGSPGTISLYLTLCYADCLTGRVPIPGDPCRTDDQLTAPSRVADDFCLELRTEAPPQVEDDALRDFVKWLRENVQVVDPGSPPVDETQWVPILRSAVQAWRDTTEASPPLSPPASVETLGDYLVDLPTPLAVPPDRYRAFLQVAFRFWVTELRPMWMARRCHSPVNKDQDCVLLAQVGVMVDWVGGSPTGVWQVAGSPGQVTLEETARPFIVHMRLLQEWLIGCALGLSSGGDSADAATSVTPETGFGLAPAVGSSIDYARADHTHGTPNVPPVPNPATSVVPETTLGLAPAVGTSSNYARADHTHGTPASLLPSLGGDASGPIPNATVNRIRNIDVFTGGATNGNVLMFISSAGSYQPRSITLGGEVTGAVSATRVARILNVPLASLSAPLQGEQFLAFRAGQWVPAGYFTVAAGQVFFPLVPVQNNQPPLGGAVSMTAAFGGLTVAPYTSSGFLFTFPGFQPASNYIVKLTPWAPKGSGQGNPFAVYFNDFAPTQGGFFVTVWVDPNPGITAAKFMIEVNQVV